jgi:energy-converting hydrogenase Eha subunit F
MRSLSKKTRQLLYIGMFLTFIALVGLFLPRQVGALQSTPNPTPTITPTFILGEEPLKSGETGGLMLGAAIILIIIIIGVLIQWVIQKNNLKVPK